MAKSIAWNTPIRAAWRRANELVSVTLAEGGLRLILLEEDTGKKWLLRFHPFQAFRVTTEELDPPTQDLLPIDGGFFKIVDSEWIRELDVKDVRFLKNAQHFVVSCYDEVIEVLAWDCSFEEVVDG